MFLSENFLKSYLTDKKKIINLLKDNLKIIDTPLLIEILKVLNNELKIRINKFELKKEVTNGRV